jgi:transcriptional regulator with XRE-family HTH domain
MRDNGFGRRLRQLRHAAKLSQADVARAACIDATYLSKVETGALEPPAEATVVRLASAINGPAETFDELVLLAGKIPADVREIILEHPEACRLLRERWGRGGRC